MLRALLVAVSFAAACRGEMVRIQVSARTETDGSKPTLAFGVVDPKIYALTPEPPASPWRLVGRDAQGAVVLDVRIDRAPGSSAMQKAEPGPEGFRSWWSGYATVDVPRSGALLELVEGERVLCAVQAGGVDVPELREVSARRVGDQIHVTARVTHPSAPSSNLVVSFHDGDSRALASFQPGLSPEGRVAADVESAAQTIRVRATDGFHVVEALAPVTATP